MAKMTKKQKEMHDLFSKMAKAKIQIKSLDLQYKVMENKAWKLLKGDTYQHPKGKFKKAIREYYAVFDKDTLCRKMTMKTYKEYSTISKTGIVQAIGEKGFNKMKDEGVVAVNSTAEFFIFTEKKAP